MNNINRLTHDDIELILELHEEGMSPEDIVPEMDHKDYITLVEVNHVINNCNNE